MAAGWTDWSDSHEEQQRVGLVHAATNGTAAALYASALITRMRGRHSRWRSLAGGALAGVGAMLGGHLGYRQSLGPNHAESVTHLGSSEWQELGAVTTLPEGKPVRRMAGAVPVVVVRRGTTVHVLADRCPHLEGPLSDGEVRDDRLVCPWHGSEFRVSDGCVVHGPATAPVPRFESRVMGDELQARVVPIPGVPAS